MPGANATLSRRTAGAKALRQGMCGVGCVPTGRRWGQKSGEWDVLGRKQWGDQETREGRRNVHDRPAHGQHRSQ